MTLSSVENQERLAVDDKIKNRYLNNLFALSSYLNQGGSILKSIRYPVLKDILTRRHKNFYIIEANKSGEQIEITSYLVIMTKASAAILVYDYLAGKWVFAGNYKKGSLRFKPNLADELTEYGRGVNNDYVVISKFINGEVVGSQYFLENTLSGASGIGSVLEMRL